MKPITHEKARQLLHRRREGLEADDHQAMEAHLFVCEDCRRYGRLLSRFERDLSRDFHNQMDPAPTPPRLSGKVQERLDRAQRRQRSYSLAWVMAGVLVLVILLFIFREVFSTSRLQSSALSAAPTGTQPARTLASQAIETAAAAAPGAAEAVSPALAAPRNLSGGRLIAFTSRRDGNEEIYVMAPDGRGQTNLTNHPAADYLPAWSPDGERLAFVSDRSGKPEIFSMASDGSGLTQLTDLPNVVDFSTLSWSPGGAQLAAGVRFLFPVSGEFFGRIFLFQTDGSGFLDLTRNQMPVTTDDPKWSPAGDWIAYVRCGQAPCYLRRVRPDGTEDEQVNLSVRNTRAYVWSPDGSQLAYITSCTYCELYDDDPADLRLASLDGSEPVTFHRFEGLSLDFFNLSWSPEGDFLAFTANEGVESVRHLFLLPSGGGELMDVAAFEPGDWYLSSLSWSPEGSHLVMDAGVVAERDIFVVDLQARLRGGVGAGVTNLTSGSPGMDYQPQWQP